MKLRTKLLLAQLPLVIALAVAIAVGSLVTSALGDRSQEILKDNYRSVLAAERMKEAAERIDSGLVFVVIGRAARGLEQIHAHLPRFEEELRAQEGNVTEPGEREATIALRAAWHTYLASVAEVQKAPEASGLDDRYFDRLLHEFLAVKGAADKVLAVNQDAMIQKGDRARRTAHQWNTLLVAISLAGLVLGLLASMFMTSRVIRPLGVLGQTARRLGEGDVAVRARVESKDEVGALARELNTMAERIHRYRQSSLGELLEAQLAARATIDSLPDPVVVIGLDGELRHANVAATEMLKVQPDAGTAGLAQLDPALRGLLSRMRQHVAAGQGAWIPTSLDEAIKRGTRDGERMLLPRAMPIRADEGDVVGVTILFQDVTRLHRFEELRDDLVATVAHELRTPLTSLRMAVHLLAEQAVGPLTAKQDDLVFAAREECDRLQTIIDELLDLSRIRSDHLELRRDRIAPEALVAESIEALRPTAAARKVQLRSELLPGTPAVVVDRERILLVLGNLLGNAIRYGPEGGAVTVSAHPSGDELRIEVRDEGPGVPADYRATIFDKYVRVPGAPSGGAGLGLFIVREVVRAHGGELGVEDAPGGGATFWFTMKLA
ncbi:MAG: ATP-binding protein [Kofleriaceae bacterium]